MMNSEQLKLLTPDTLGAAYPRILMMDMDADSVQSLSTSCAVTVGSFGQPYRFQGKQRITGFFESEIDPVAPIRANYQEAQEVTENDVIILDVASPIADVEPDCDVWRDSEGVALLANWQRNRMLDPRPLAMFSHREAFEKILFRKGGVIVIFADVRREQEVPGYGLQTWGHNTRPFDNWCFLKLFDYPSSFQIVPEAGTRIRFGSRGSIASLLEKHKSGARFTCTLDPPAHLADAWTPSAWDSYGAPVAGLIQFSEDDQENPATIILLPRLRERAAFLTELVADVLPTISPHLYPQLNGWRYERSYELPSAWRLRQEQQHILEEAHREIDRLQAEIEQERLQYGFLHDLLTAQDQPLVAAVHQTLELLGFSNITNTDSQLDAQKKPRREDLQVAEAGMPLLLVEVKGIKGLPTDSDALQVAKHVTCSGYLTHPF